MFTEQKDNLTFYILLAVILTFVGFISIKWLDLFMYLMTVCR